MSRVIGSMHLKSCVRSYRGVRLRCEAAATPIAPLNLKPDSVAHNAAQAVISAVSSSTCAPYMDYATDNTLILNPPWSKVPRAQGMDNAECGVLTATEYSSEDVSVLAGQMEADGSGFLLWERKAWYEESGEQKSEDVCGCSYIQMEDGEATIIATFRQPTPIHVDYRCLYLEIKYDQASKVFELKVERKEFFNPESELAVLPGNGNFFRGHSVDENSNRSTASMLRAATSFYDAWAPGKAEACLEAVAGKNLHILEPIWQEIGDFLPVNRVEASMWIERQAKRAGGELHFEPKVVSRAEGTNLVFTFWVATGPRNLEVSGIHVFSFDSDGQIDSIAAFREPFPRERKLNLLGGK